MSWPFFQQPSKSYRNFQFVYIFFVLNFVIPAISYAVAPEVAIGQFRRTNTMLGGADYTFPEEQSRVWRYLGAANVMTLGLLCALLTWDLKRYRPVLGPLIFLKGYNASLFLFGWFAARQYPVLLAVALYDYLTCVGFWYFATRAYEDVKDRPDSELVPPPRWRS